MQPNFRLHAELNNLFSDYLPLPCYLVLLDKPDYGYALGPTPPRTHPIYFEAEFGKVPARFAHNRAQMKRRGPLKPFISRFAGLNDLFVPIRGATQRIEAYLLFGAFHLTLPDRRAMWTEWCRLRGAAGPEDAREFLMYVHTLCETPVLERSQVLMIGKLLSLVGNALLGSSRQDAAVAAIDKAKRELFGPRLPWRMWHYAEARRNRYQRGIFQGAELAPWDAEEFRLKRGPDSAIGLVPREAEDDAAAAMISATRLQLAVVDYCRQYGGLVAGRLGTEGALILMSGKRLELRDRALHALQTLSKQCGMRLVASFGGRPRQPALVDLSIQEVETGLRLALARGIELLEADAESTGPGQQSVDELGQSLLESLAQGQRDGLRLQREALSTAALKASGGRAELLRIHLRYGLNPLLQSVLRRSTSKKAASDLKALVEASLASASSAEALLRSFASLLDELVLRYDAPAQGDLKARLRRASGRLLSSPEEVVSLNMLARESGLSKFHFSRLFKATSGLGFAKARLEARIVKARRLLVATDTSISSIASDCGFKNSGYFSTVFKRSEGLSPRLYRSKNRKLD